MFYPHKVTVENRLASGGMGGGFAAARTVQAEVKDKALLVRGADGAEVVSSTQVTVALPETVPVGSRVTVWPGTANQRRGDVLSVQRDENGGMLDSFLILFLN